MASCAILYWPSFMHYCEGYEYISSSQNSNNQIGWNLKIGIHCYQSNNRYPLLLMFSLCHCIMVPFISCVSMTMLQELHNCKWSSLHHATHVQKETRCMVWCGVEWCGVEWCGVVWCGVVWCGVVWYGVVWCGVAWCGVVCWLWIWVYIRDWVGIRKENMGSYPWKGIA